MIEKKTCILKFILIMVYVWIEIPIICLGVVEVPGNMVNSWNSVKMWVGVYCRKGMVKNSPKSVLIL